MNSEFDIKQAVAEELARLVSPTEAAKLKKMSLNAFKYRLSQPGAPMPVTVGDGHLFYRRDEVKAWRPTIHKISGRK